MVSRTRVQNKFTVKVVDFINEVFKRVSMLTTASKNIDTKEKLAKEVKRVYKQDVNPDSIADVKTVYTLYEMDDETFYKYATVVKVVEVDGCGFTDVPADFRAKENN